MDNLTTNELVTIFNDYAGHLILAYQPESIEENGIMALHYSFGSLDDNRSDFLNQLREKVSLLVADTHNLTDQELVKKELDKYINDWEEKFNDVYNNK